MIQRHPNARSRYDARSPFVPVVEQIESAESLDAIADRLAPVAGATIASAAADGCVATGSVTSYIRCSPIFRSERGLAPLCSTCSAVVVKRVYVHHSRTGEVVEGMSETLNTYRIGHVAKLRHE